MQRPLTFKRYGKAFHAVIEDARDLGALERLDLAHWVALSAPIDTLDADPVFLREVDADRDGRLRQFEVESAIRWTLGRLADHAGIDAGTSTLTLAAIAVADEEGRALHALADAVHGELLKPPTDRTVTLAELRGFIAALEKRAVSSSGVVVPDPALDAEINGLLQAIISVTGGVPHPSGAAGVDLELFDTFVAQARAWRGWWSERDDPAVMPFGDRTDALFAAYEAVAEKVDQYFVQCDAVRLDPTLGPQFARPLDALPALVHAGAADLAAALAGAPLARPIGDRVLSLVHGINPRFERAIAALREGPVAHVLAPGEASPPQRLTAEDWAEVQAAFAGHRRWRERAVAPHIAPLGRGPVDALLDGPVLPSARKVIEDSALISQRLTALRQLERLALFQANILRLANNYVAFPEVYERARRALFDTGDLVIDGRRLNLTVRVRDRARHIAVANSSNICVLYVEVSAAGTQPFEVAAAVTSGGRGNLSVGKRGLFLTPRGVQLDAKVVHIVENPISLGEAIVAPFVRLGNAITGKIESIAADAEKRLDTHGAAVVAPVADPKPGSASLIAGGGIAVAAMSSSAAYITKTLAGMTWMKMLGGLGAAIAAVAIPATIVALIKLNRRDLSCLLEGSGWAINTRMRITWRLARYFTERPRIPLTPMGLVLSLWQWWGSAILMVVAGLVWWFKIH